MRLWSLHPRYLDAKGLTALWREALLARAVLRGETRGYRAHPQLQRFREQASPRSAINAYLAAVFADACVRGYSFDRSKSSRAKNVASISVTRGQVAFELEHLRGKLRERDPARLKLLPRSGAHADVHPSFRVIEGPIAWERAVLERRKTL